MIKSELSLKTGILENLLSDTSILIASQHLKAFLMRLMIKKICFKILHNEICQYLQELHNSVNKYFLMITSKKNHLWVKEPKYY